MGYNALQEYKWALRSDKSRHSLDSVNRKCSYFRSYIKKFKFKGKKWEQSCAILLEQGKTPKMIVPILLKMGEHGNISGSHPPLRGGQFYTIPEAEDLYAACFGILPLCVIPTGSKPRDMGCIPSKLNYFSPSWCSFTKVSMHFLLSLDSWKTLRCRIQLSPEQF